MKSIRLILFVSLILFSRISYSQENCKRDIRNYLERMHAYAKPDPGKVYFLDMTVETQYKPETGNKDSKVNIKVSIAGEKVRYESSVVSFYMDSRESFTILHPQRTIIWGDGGGRNKQDKYTSVLAIQDTLLDHSSVKKCIQTELDGKKVKQIWLTADRLFQNATGITGVEYIYALKEERLLSAVTYFSEESAKKRESVIYSRLDYNYKVSPFSSAASMILTDKGGLQQKYRGYELIDNRNFSKK